MSSMMPSKVYVIAHDGTNVLLGRGGRSGKYKSTRLGYHLPGGSIDRSKDIDYQRAALREFSEETGIDSNELKIIGCVDSTSAPNVQFVVAKVSSVANLVSAFKRPVVVNPYDEPFSELISLPLVKCWENENFNAKYYTDWFKHGLFAAQDHFK